MPGSFLEAYNAGYCDKTSQLSPTLFQRNNAEPNGNRGGRFSPVGALHGDIRTPPSPRRAVPGHPRQVEAVSPRSGVKQHFRRASDEKCVTAKQHFRRASDERCLTPPSKKRQWMKSSSSASNIATKDAPQQLVPPQIRRNGRGMSPVPLFKRSSTSTSSLGSVQSIEEDCESDRSYVAPGRLSALPPLDSKREHSSRSSSEPTIINLTRCNSPTPPKKPLPAIPTSNAARQFHSPQPPRKSAVTANKSAMTPPVPRRNNLPAPLVLTPPSEDSMSGPSSPLSPGLPRRHAPLPPFEKSPSSSRRLSPMPPPSCQDSSSPKLPPKPPHLKSSPATSPCRRSPSPCHFSYSPPASPSGLSLSSETPPVIPARVPVLQARCRAPIPPPPVTSQPARSARPPLPLPKTDNLQKPSVIVTSDCNELSNQSHCRVVKQSETKSKKSRNRDHHGRRSPPVSRHSQQVTEKSKKDKEEEEEGCCATCLKDCVSDLPEYLLDFFC